MYWHFSTIENCFGPQRNKQFGPEKVNVLGIHATDENYHTVVLIILLRRSVDYT